VEQSEIHQFTEHFVNQGDMRSSVDPVIHFGLGRDTSADSIKVTWPATGVHHILKKYQG